MDAYTVGRIPLDEGSVFCVTKQYSHRTDIHAASGIQTRNPRSERPKTHTLDRTATGIGAVKLNVVKTENTTNQLHTVT